MRHRLMTLRCIATALVLAATSPAMSGGTLKIEGLAALGGASNEMGYTTGWDRDIIRRVRWEATLDPTTGKPSVGDYYITKAVHRSTPRLYRALFTKEQMTSATVVLERDTSTSPVKFLEFHMTDVVVTSINTHVPMPGEMPEDEFSLGFSKIEWEFTRHDPATSEPIETIKGGYDAVAGTFLPGTTGVNPAWFNLR